MMKLVSYLLFAMIPVTQSAIGTNRVTSSSTIAAKNQCVPCKRPDTGVDNKAPDVTNLELDKTQIVAATPKEGEPDKPTEHSRDMMVSVKTTAVDPEGDVLVYRFTVSGGRVVGQGANVTWDLNRLKPGTYTITAGVDDGCGICGKTMTQAVTVIEDSK